MNWSDVVISDNLGVEKLTLEQALFKFANLNELHDYVDSKCLCTICQVLAPMARKLEQALHPHDEPSQGSRKEIET